MSQGAKPKTLSSRMCNLSVVPRLLISCCFSLFIILLPWESVVEDAFPDRSNYIAAFEGVDELDPAIVLAISGFWKFAVVFWSQFGLMPDTFLDIVSFLTLFSITFFLLGFCNPFFVCFFLVNPLIVDLVMAQQRSALALSFFIIWLSLDNKIARFFIVLAGLLTHLLFALFITGHFIAKTVSKVAGLEPRSWNRLLQFIIIFVAAIISLLGKDVIFLLLGDSRVESSSGSSSLIYGLFWLCMIFYLIAFNYQKDWISSFVLFFISLFIVATLLDVYSLRYLSVVFPFFLIALSQARLDKALLSYLLMFAYSLTQWMYWLRLV